MCQTCSFPGGWSPLALLLLIWRRHRRRLAVALALGLPPSAAAQPPGPSEAQLAAEWEWGLRAGTARPGEPLPPFPNTEPAAPWWPYAAGAGGLALLLARRRRAAAALLLAGLLAGAGAAQEDRPRGWVSSATRLKAQLRRSLSPAELELCRAQDERELDALGGKPAAPACPPALARLNPAARAAWAACSPAAAERLVRFAEAGRLAAVGERLLEFFALVAAYGDPAADYLMANAPRLGNDPAAWAAVAADPHRHFRPPPAPPAAGFRAEDVAWYWYALGGLGLLLLLKPRSQPKEESW